MSKNCASALLEGDCGNLRTTTAYDQSLHPFFPLCFSANHAATKLARGVDENKH